MSVGKGTMVNQVGHPRRIAGTVRSSGRDAMETLTRRCLNRATLERQLLLRRVEAAPLDVVERWSACRLRTPTRRTSGCGPGSPPSASTI
jgi:hypothetical protein